MLCDNAIIEKIEEMGDWYTIRRGDVPSRPVLRFDPDNGCMSLMDDSRLGNADVEGPAIEMLDIAACIRNRTSAVHGRCAVEMRDDRAEFYSPRNSMRHGFTTIEAADRLADQIEALCGNAEAGTAQ